MTDEDTLGRVRRARMIARGELAVAVAAVVLYFFLWVGAPGYMGGYDPGPWQLLGLVVPGLATVWMLRIYRSRPEDGERTWRYRDF